MPQLNSPIISSFKQETSADPYTLLLFFYFLRERPLTLKSSASTHKLLAVMNSAITSCENSRSSGVLAAVLSLRNSRGKT